MFFRVQLQCHYCFSQCTIHFSFCIECADVCPFLYEPKCGSNGETYSNQCWLTKAACEQGIEITMVFDGRCEDRPAPGRFTLFAICTVH